MAAIHVSATEAPRVRAGAGGVIEDGSLTVTDVATASLVSGSFVWGWFLHIRGVHDLKRPIRFCDAEFWFCIRARLSRAIKIANMPGFTGCGKTLVQV